MALLDPFYTLASCLKMYTLVHQRTPSSMRPSVPIPVTHLSEMPYSTVHSPLILTGTGTGHPRYVY